MHMQGLTKVPSGGPGQVDFEAKQVTFCFHLLGKARPWVGYFQIFGRATQQEIGSGEQILGVALCKCQVGSYIFIEPCTYITKARLPALTLQLQPDLSASFLNGLYRWRKAQFIPLGILFGS